MTTSQIHAWSHDRCRTLPASVPLGRVAFVRDGRPVIEPVGITVTDDAVRLRAGRTPRADLTDGRRIAPAAGRRRRDRTGPAVNRRRGASAVLAGTLVLALTACAPAANSFAETAALPGFWLGLWHGFICPITFLVSLFNDHVGVYEVRNDGHWYDFGFVSGILLAASVFHSPHYARSRPGRRTS